MFRKFFAVVAATALVVGGLFAEDVKGIFKKYEDGKVTVDVDGTEKTYKVSPNAKFKTKKGELPLADALKFIKDGQKTALVLTVDDGVVTSVKKDKKNKKQK